MYQYVKSRRQALDVPFVFLAMIEAAGISARQGKG